MDIQSSDRIILRALRGSRGGRIERCVLSSIWFDDTHLLFTSKYGGSIDQSYLNHMSGKSSRIKDCFTQALIIYSSSDV